jgi:uncharacterized protein YxjI
MELKIQCGCGTKYAFDVEPVNGRMPTPVGCPSCGTDGTYTANEMLAKIIQPAPVTATATAASTALRVSRPPETAAPAPGTSYGAVPAYGSSASLLERSTYFIKEHASILKLTDTYDILDPATGQQIGVAKEEPPLWAKWLRLAIEKRLMPTAINFYEIEGQPPVLSIHRGFTFLRSKVHVIAGGRKLGYFRSKLISLGGGFLVFDHADQQVAEVKGDWKGWNFRFLNKGGREIGTVTKKWAGLGKELFTSADNYIISITDPSTAGADTSALLLAAGLAIDVVYKEKE